ncbi:MAG: outer membrane beta-barrel protein [Rikenellaceae bacterium]
MKNIVKIVLFIFTLLYTPLYAQELVKGKVQSMSGLPVQYAAVILQESADSSIVGGGTITDSEGFFELKNEEDNSSSRYITISCLGYKDKNVNLPLNNEVIILEDQNMYLEEAQVIGQRKFSTIGDNGTLYTIKNSVLTNEASTIDLLTKIPGLRGDNTSISTISGETPTIYVDGRELYSIDELKNIAPTQIRSVELVENPGAKYGADVKAVVLVKTYQKTDGFDLFLNEMVVKNKFWGYSNNLNANYNVGKLNFSAVFEYSDLGQGSTQERYLKNSGTDVWENYVDMETLKNRNKSLSGMFSLNYNINKNHTVGAMYNHRSNKINSLFSLHTESFKNSILDSEVDGLSHLEQNNNGDLFNLFYIGKVSEKSEINFFADYLNNSSDRNQYIEEVSLISNEESLTTMNSPSNYELFAGKLLLDHTINDKNRFTVGAEVTKVSGDGETNYVTGIGDDAKYKLSEAKVAGFLDYNLKLEPITLTAGLRYEYTQTEYKDLINPEYDIDREYGNLLPSLSMKYKIGKTNHIFSYSAKVSRPSYSNLGSYSSYINEFQIEEGNPSLKESLRHSIQYITSYKDFSATFMYSYIKDYIAMNILNDSEDEKVSIYTWSNYDKYQSLKLFLNYSKRFKFYEPMYTAAYIQPLFNVTYLDENQRIDKPTFYLEMCNYFHITPLFTANVDYIYTSGGVAEIYTSQSTHRFDASLNYKLFKKTLMIGISVQDIFNKEIDRLSTYINNTYTTSIENNDRRSIRLNISWRFNSAKTGYKGRLAGESEINRL